MDDASGTSRMSGRLDSHYLRLPASREALRSNPRLLLPGAWARRPAAGYVCWDGGGRRRPPQQKRRALGGEPHIPDQFRSLANNSTAGGGLRVPRRPAPAAALRRPRGPPRESPGSPPRSSRPPCRAAHGIRGRACRSEPSTSRRYPRRIQVSREPRVSTIAQGAAWRGPRTSGQAARQPDTAPRPPPNPRLLLAGRERGGSRAVKFSSGTRGCRRTPRSRSAGR